uniref:TF-B3 domain-containing protein n=1 Tax=Ananas comosus var. bracteatus TaxID=296719 RepID=A0A6V7Q176_ANACO|nr:unnamed protein product [Ananas comosus var. bracteatus]
MRRALVREALDPQRRREAEQASDSKQHAEKHFPLDAEAGEKGLILSFEDEAGKSWQFRYSYWSSSQSYVLTKGWSRYVKEKRLDAGDVVAFGRSRAGAGDRLFIIGCRRSGGHDDAHVPWSSSSSSHVYLGSPVQQDNCYNLRAGGHKDRSADSPVPTSAPAPENPRRLRLFGVNLECGPDLQESESACLGAYLFNGARIREEHRGAPPGRGGARAPATRRGGARGGELRLGAAPRARLRPRAVARPLPRHVALPPPPRPPLRRRRRLAPQPLLRRVPVPRPQTPVAAAPPRTRTPSPPRAHLRRRSLPRGRPLLSRVVATDASSPWFLGSPFRIDALDRKSPPPEAAAAACPAAELELSWILIDPARGRAVNLSSRRPVAVGRHWYTGETLIRYATVAGEFLIEATVTLGEETGHVREVSLRVGDADGAAVCGGDSLVILRGLMEGERRRRGGGGGGEEEEEAKRRYEEFVKRKRNRKAAEARKELLLDFCCSAVGAAVFLAIVLTALLR